jgi:hypothetical protein
LLKIIFTGVTGSFAFPREANGDARLGDVIDLSHSACRALMSTPATAPRRLDDRG